MNSDSPETEKTFLRLTTEFPQFGEAWTNLALSRAKKGEIDGAIEALQKGQSSVISAKEQAKILRALGAFYIEKATKGLKAGATGDTALIGKAQEAFNKSLTLESDMADAYHGLGLAASWLGQLDDAVRNFERAIRLKPKYAAAYNDLGAVYVAQKNKKSEALKAFQKAVDLEDNDIYRKTYQKNLEDLQKSIKKN
jgi:tetratricopeptide (TPR) repeat protein